MSAPSERRARVVTVYAVPGSSSPPATQVMLSPDIFPGTGPAAEVTATLRSVPPSASRVSRVSTGTSRAPFSTLDIRRTGGTSGSGASV